MLACRLSLLIALGLTLGCTSRPLALDGSADSGIDSSMPPDASVPIDAGPPPRVLFIGNSYTYVNDLPGVVHAIGQATPGAAVEVDSRTAGSATFGTHAASAETLDHITNGGFDVVVLQGQSLKGNGGGGEGTDYGADILSDTAHAAGARPVFFATWPRRAGDPIYTESFGPAEMNARIESTYRRIAAPNRDMIARVGAAFELARIEMPEVALHSEDGSHPSAAGTLLAACTILNAITARTPRLPSPAPLGVPQDTAEALCALAPRVLCFEGWSYCNQICVDLRSDPMSCGVCGRECNADDPCEMGECGCSDEALTGCGRYCYDLMSDDFHCGSCARACDPGRNCEAGECECLPRSVQDVSVAVISAIRPACTAWQDVGTVDCLAGGHTYCAAQDCFNAGLGPPGGHSPVIDRVMCLNAEVRTTSYTELAALVPACDGTSERDGPNCATAIHRYCVATGAASGFGPVGIEGESVTVNCVAEATVVHTALADLHASRCVPDAVSCGIASWEFCASRGHAAGWGPIEVGETEADVVCLDL